VLVSQLLVGSCDGWIGWGAVGYASGGCIGRRDQGIKESRDLSAVSGSGYVKPYTAA
jgi:hypothetical protein